jgi:hypothetical protein
LYARLSHLFEIGHSDSDERIEKGRLVESLLAICTPAAQVRGWRRENGSRPSVDALQTGHD